ncbi:MAG: Fe-Mn family superoxide dismutase [Candidatus Uhrbacteria bacterium]|nr:Fe-Mn family superoxide dismutase [Patescibacteria group bacterium]MBU1907351.1 Fe-Mn family superoxide dismutase [Patescibacteria group bacterium]
MNYEVKDFSHLLGTPGFSDELLNNHFTLYEGYVVNTTKISTRIAELAEADQTDLPEFAELKRRFGWEYNGMRLHELYFENLSKEPKELDPESGLAKHLIETYNKLAKWEKYFRATGSLRGIGWVVMYWDSINQRTKTVWINEHDVGHLVGLTPLLVMDVFEHAFLTDYGLKRADYIDAFMKAVDWEVVNNRFEAAK